MNRKTLIPFKADSQRHAIEYLKGILEDAAATTLQRVVGIPTEELHWQHAEGWNTVGALLSHIIATRRGFIIHFIEDREPTAEEWKPLEPGATMGKFLPQLITDQPIEFYLEALESSKQEFLQAIDGLSNEDFFRKREGYNPETGHNLAWTLYHVAEDEVHHRGQISLIRKLYKSIHQTQA